MTRYFLFGGFRNLLGIVLLSTLVWKGIHVTPALLIVVSIDLFLYLLQVRLSVGQVHGLMIVGVYTSVFFANRFLLWLLYERLGAPIYVAQAISILLLTSGGYLILKRWRRPARGPTDAGAGSRTIGGRPPGWKMLSGLWQRRS